jgi:hypothetical protein
MTTYQDECENMTGALEQARTCFWTSTDVCEISTILVVSDDQAPQIDLLARLHSHSDTIHLFNHQETFL